MILARYNYKGDLKDLDLLDPWCRARSLINGGGVVKQFWDIDR